MSLGHERVSGKLRRLYRRVDEAEARARLYPRTHLVVMVGASAPASIKRAETAQTAPPTNTGDLTSHVQH